MPQVRTATTQPEAFRSRTAAGLRGAPDRIRFVGQAEFELAELDEDDSSCINSCVQATNISQATCGASAAVPAVKSAKSRCNEVLAVEDMQRVNEVPLRVPSRSEQSASHGKLRACDASAKQSLPSSGQREQEKSISSNTMLVSKPHSSHHTLATKQFNCNRATEVPGKTKADKASGPEVEVQALILHEFLDKRQLN